MFCFAAGEEKYEGGTAQLEVGVVERNRRQFEAVFK